MEQEWVVYSFNYPLVSIWTESHKIWKVWALINQVLTRCFPSCGVWLINEIIKPVGISESTDINQSIWMNQFYPIEAWNFIIIQYFQHTWEEFAIGSKKHQVCDARCHPLSTYAKFSKKLTFLTLWYAHLRVRIRGLEMLVSRKILSKYLMDGP